MHFKTNKNSFKKIILALLCNLLIVFNLVSCGWDGVDCVKKLGDEEINFSEFLLLTSLKTISAKSKTKGELSFEDTDFESFKESEIEGSPALDYVKNQVNDEMEEILVKREAAKKLKVNLTDQEKDTVKKNGYNKYKEINNSFKASKIGISLKDCENLILWDMLDNKIGEQLYGKGKSGEVKDETVKNYLKDKKNVKKYKFLKIPKKFKEEEKKESPQKKLEKNFSVKTSKELAEKMLKKSNEEKKSLEDIQKELNEGLGEEITSVEEKVSYLNEKDDEKFNFNEDSKFDEGIKKFLNEMEEKKETKKIFETETHLYVIETLDMDDESVEKEKEKTKGIIEKKIKEDYLKDVRKEFKEKIETDESKFNDSVIAKQVKKVFENLVYVSQFPFPF